jgi:inner membrane protein
VDHDVKKALDKQAISYNRYFTTPAPFQNLLWYVVAGNDSGYYVGYRSVFDRSKTISFCYVPANRYLLAGYANQREIDLLTQFSQQWYAIEKWHDTLVFNDLRFGQIAGWADSAAHFSFHYFLGDSLGNRYVMQRGRIKGWTSKSINRFFKRIMGN